ncbi:MAG: SusD/RagB family nutrient-binding outer membrane lipoprotein [Bacteroidales bacterium]|nr:SusD/RagB family nutrient-binding outer membrane lipoprotein [Bacteroidales bacterium]
MKKTIIAIMTVALAFMSCTKGFEEMNRNPNQLSEANPEYLLNTSVYQTLKASCGAIKKNLLDNYVQYCYGQTNQMGRYGDIPTTNSEYFKAFYNYALLPLQFIEDDYSDNGEYVNRVAIARIWKYYVFSQVTSIWGPVPMSGALKGTTSVPYDDEPTIYNALLGGLKECAEAIDLEGDRFLHDPVFAGEDGKSNLNRWVKFANSLRLRLAVRICNADRELAMSHISDLMEDESLLMESNADNCTVKWGDNESTRNYYYDYFIIQTTNLDKANSAGECFLMYTAPYKDPRLEKFFTKCTSSQMPADFHWAPYWGKPKTDHTPVSGMLDSSNPHAGVPATAYSVMLDSYFAANYTQMILSYAEVCLLKAELVHLGLGSGTESVSDYYYDGIRASMQQFGVTDEDAIRNYLNVDGIDFDTLTDLDVSEEGERYFMDYLGLCSSAIKDDGTDGIYTQIIMQQYIALFNQAIDAWTLLRRSQVLDIVPHYQPELGYGAVNAGSSDVEFSYLPMRLKYPSSELQDNAEETAKAQNLLAGGADAMDTPLWWAKPQKINKNLQDLVDNYNKQ